MKSIILSSFFASLIFLIIDIIWLSFSVKTFYRPNIGHLLIDKPIIWAAVLFYVIYVLGVAILVIEPSIKSDSLLKAFYTGFIFGFVAYGTYNLTNMATIKGWSSSVVFVDMLWGGFLTAFSAYLGILINKKFFII
mgnify:CR=1 FL=1